MRKQDNEPFWLSYSDLMTNLFFVMLVLFATTLIVLRDPNNGAEGLRRRVAELEDSLSRMTAMYDAVVVEKRQMENILQLTDQFKALSSSSSLRYDDDHKTFIAKDFEGIEIFEQEGRKIKPEYISSVKKVGKDLDSVLKKLNQENPSCQFMLVIEGTTANDPRRPINVDSESSYKLSFDRALALYRQWKSDGLDLRQYNTEILICGSGMNGINRAEGYNEEKNNKRFVIQIIPKVARTDQ